MAGKSLESASPLLGMIPIAGPFLSAGAKVAGGIMESQDKPGITGGGGGSGPTTPYAPSANSQYYAGMPLNPAQSSDFSNWLRSQTGKGATPFNATTALPGGGTTKPGQLTAPNNQLIQHIMQSFIMPGGVMEEMQRTGLPIDQTQAWKAMVASMQRQIAEGGANLKEGMSAGGNLVGSPYGKASTDYYSQTGKDLNAQLLEGQARALEAARGRQMGATQMGEQFGMGIQGLDQEAIQRMYQEFIRTRPEYNPLINTEYGMATTFPQYMGKESGGGILGGLLSNSGGIMNMLQGLMKKPGGDGAPDSTLIGGGNQDPGTYTAANDWGGWGPTGGSPDVSGGDVPSPNVGSGWPAGSGPQLTNRGITPDYFPGLTSF